MALPAHIAKNIRPVKARLLEAVIGGGVGAGVGAVTTLNKPEIERPERVLGGALTGGAVALLGSFASRGAALRRVARIRAEHMATRGSNVLLPVAGEVQARKILSHASDPRWVNSRIKRLRIDVGNDIMQQRVDLTVENVVREFGKKGERFPRAFMDGMAGKSRRQWTERGKKYLSAYDDGQKMGVFQDGYLGRGRPKGMLSSSLEEVYVAGKNQRLGDFADRNIRNAIDVESRRVLQQEIIKARKTVRASDIDTKVRVKRMLRGKAFGVL